MSSRSQWPPNRRRIFFPLVLLAGALALGALVMVLWNAILPAALHAGRLSYWQGVGLLVLCRMLFGSWGGGRGPGLRRSGGPQERWLDMSEDERQTFRQRWQARGPHRGWPPPGTAPNAPDTQP